MDDKEREEVRDILESKNFSQEDIEVLIRLIKFYEKYELQLKEIVDREVVSELWAGARVKLYKIVKWVLGSFLLLVAILQGWQSVLAIFFKDVSQ